MSAAFSVDCRRPLSCALSPGSPFPAEVVRRSVQRIAGSAGDLGQSRLLGGGARAHSCISDPARTRLFDYEPRMADQGERRGGGVGLDHQDGRLDHERRVGFAGSRGGAGAAVHQELGDSLAQLPLARRVGQLG